MASLFGLGGSAADTDRSHLLTSQGELEDLFHSQSKFGKSQEAIGAGALGDALNYFRDLMSGDPGKVSQAIAPEASAIRNQTATARATNDQFSNRSGGTNATSLSLENESEKEIQALIDSLIPNAAKEVGTLGATIESGGQNALNMALNAAGTEGSLAVNSEHTTLPIEQQQQQEIIKGIMELVGGFA